LSAVAFDNTMLSILLSPAGRVPEDPNTGKAVEEAQARAEAVVQTIQRSRRKIILPAPACAELLTVIGPDAQQYINIVGRSRVFEVGNFDGRAAAELALLNRSTFLEQDERHKLDTYQKRKVDRQIVAICKVYGVTEIYTDDGGLANRSLLCGITPVSISEVPIPDSARQGKLSLDEHEPIPEPDDGE
jgi:predicted nucleic acid-binding protein